MSDSMSVPEIAKYLRVSRERVRRWIKTGELKGLNTRDNGMRPRYVVLRDDLDTFIKSREVVQDVGEGV